MISADAISALNRLHYLMLRSFAAYSVEVRPVTFRGPREMHDLLKQITDEQHALAERIAETIREQNVAVESGQFSIEFTSWNDVALPRILLRAIELFREIVAEADAIGTRDPRPPVFHFAKEVQNLTRQHVELLEGVLAPKVESA